MEFNQINKLAMKRVFAASTEVDVYGLRKHFLDDIDDIRFLSLQLNFFTPKLQISLVF